MLPIYDGRADAVYGSRFAGYPRRVLFFWHSLGNKMLTMLSNMLCDLNLTDMETGYKAIRKDMVRSMVLKSNRFGIEPEITAKLARMRARIYEVPISYSGRSYNEGKKIGWKDAVSAVWTMLRCAITDDRGSVDPLHATLRRMAALDRYNAFLFEQIAAVDRPARARGRRRHRQPHAVPARPRRRGRDRRRSGTTSSCCGARFEHSSQRRRRRCSTSPPRSRPSSPGSASTPSSA